MGGRHQPEQGADSPQSIAGYVNPDGSGEGNWSVTLDYHAYKVHMEEELGARWWITVAHALGPNDARHQAVEKAIDQGYMDVTAGEVRCIS
jgi:hypothetical protein